MRFWEYRVSCDILFFSSDFVILRLIVNMIERGGMKVVTKEDIG